MINELMFTALTACNWDNPGHDPYTNTVSAALSQFSIPAAHKNVIEAQIKAGANTGMVFITKDGLVSPDRNLSTFMMMTFGKNKMCYGVERTRWADSHYEPAKLYCSGDYCVMIPTVCGNITQVFPRQTIGEPADERHPVPAPGAFWLMLGGLILLFKGLKR